MVELSASIFYSLFKDAWGWFVGRRRSLSPSQIVALRAKWAPEFEDELYRNFKNHLSRDVIIHDMRRLDDYPEPRRVDRKRISPWFRAALVGTYHRGALICLGIHELVEDKKGRGWHFASRDAPDAEKVKTYLIGKVPFEFVESVSWQGDHYYIYPHIFCWFDGRLKEPYEELTFAVEFDGLGGRPHYRDIALQKDVLSLTKKLKVKRF